MGIIIFGNWASGRVTIRRGPHSEVAKLACERLDGKGGGFIDEAQKEMAKKYEEEKKIAEKLAAERKKLEEQKAKDAKAKEAKGGKKK